MAPGLSRPGTNKERRRSLSAPSSRSSSKKPTTRTRAPTITIDTTAVNPDASAAGSDATTAVQVTPEQPLSAADEYSPITTRLSQTSSQTAVASPSDGTAKPPSESTAVRPTSAHNVSSPVTAKNSARDAFLAVPSNLRSRQNSVESDDTSRSQISETVIGSVSHTGSRPNASHGNSSRDAAIGIKNDERALEPDLGTEAAFVVDQNPFAFSPGQLNKMFSPKSLAAFWRLGGMDGIERGLRTNRVSGLSTDESHLEGVVRFDEVAPGHKEQSVQQGSSISHEASVPGTRPPNATDEPFADRKRVFMDNMLPGKRGKSLLELMWITYNDKVLILLSIAAVVSLAIGLYQTFGVAHNPADGASVEWVEGVAIVVAIVVVVLVGSLNDWQKERQFAKLNNRKTDRQVKVIRSGKTRELSVFDLLAGDVVCLEPGDLIPVDGILIQGTNVNCDESHATGESDIIRKKAAGVVFKAIKDGDDLHHMDPFIQSGASVMEGEGTFLVTSTGIHSTYGKTLMALDESPEITPLQSKLNIIAEYIAKLGGAAGLLLFLVLFIMFCIRLPKSVLSPADKGQQFLEIFIVVVTIIVVAVPEGLPLAVTLALAFATTRMLKENNLVRHLKACEVMGNATQICSDKTGTLTQNKMQVVAGCIGSAVRFGDAGSIEGESAAASAALAVDIGPREAVKMLSQGTRDLLLKSIAYNSTAFEGSGDGERTFIGSKTESAMLNFAQEHLGMTSVSEVRATMNKVALYPFDSKNKCMGVVAWLPDGRVRLYVKGASEIVLKMCNQILRDPAKDPSAAPMSDENRDTIGKLITAYGSNSLRTIGIVYRDFDNWPPPRLRSKSTTEQEIDLLDITKHMIFVAVMGIKDPLRPGVLKAVRQCQHAGVTVRMVTGDNKYTAEAIARDCGILQPHSLVMEGPDFRNLTKRQQDEVLPRLHVLARSSPEDKRILVRRLKDKGEIVAVTGDGTNDAPALHLADVGFSMGQAGTEVAKEASAIILMDDNFASIVTALKWGRAVNDAVKRFLQFQLTVNITAVLLTFVTAVSDPSERSVLRAVQLLWVNLIMDTLAALALATDPPNDNVLNRLPEPRGASMISTTMWKMIFGQAIYQLAITFMLYYGGIAVLPFDDTVQTGQIQTLIFNTFVWMQIFNQWNNRRLDNKFNIFEGMHKNWFFIGINVIMVGGQVLIILFGGAAFSIAAAGQTNSMWGYAIVLGALSLPVGIIIRLIPDRLLEALIPHSFKHHAHPGVPGLTVSDEERFHAYPVPFAEVRDELTFIKRMKGGRLNNLRFAMAHPRDFIKTRSPSHSREHSRTELREGSHKAPSTPTREDSYSSAAPTPDSRRRSRSMRSRSNSALGAATVMSGIVAGSIAAGWSPTARSGQDKEFGSFPRPSGEYQRTVAGDRGAEDKETTVSGGLLTDEPLEMDSVQQSRPVSSEVQVPRLKMPQPPGERGRK